MRRYVVGIDPGRKGGIVFLDDLAIEILVFKMPESIEEIYILLKEREKRIWKVFIEKQSPFPRQGVVSMFKLGFHYGNLLGCLKILGIDYEEISSQKWKRYFGILGKGSRKERKEKAIEKVRELFRGIEERIGMDLSRNDGIAEAILIAEYGRNYLKRLMNKNEVNFLKKGIYDFSNPYLREHLIYKGAFNIKEKYDL